MQFRSASTVEGSTTVRRPARVVKGDLLLAALQVDDSPVNVNAPPGWTLVQDVPAAIGTGEDFHALVYRKIATAAEPASYTFQVQPSTWTDIHVVAYSGVNAANPIDAVSGRYLGITSIPTAPPISPTSTHDRLVLVFMDFVPGHWRGAAGLTERTDDDGNAIMDQALGPAGPTGTRHARTSRRGPVAVIVMALRS